MSGSNGLKDISVWSVATKIFLLYMLTLISLLTVTYLVDTEKGFMDNLFSFIVNIGIIIIIFSSFKKTNIKRKHIIGGLSLRNKGWIKYISIQLLLSLFGIVSLLTLLFLFAGMFEDKLQETMAKATDIGGQSINISSTIIKILITLLLAPIAEEILFRGFLFNRWGATMGVGKSMILSSLLFSIVHFDNGLLGRFLLGVFFCIIYLKTKQLIIPIILHALNNLIAMSPLIADLTLFNSTNTNIEVMPHEAIRNLLMLGLKISGITYLVLIPIIIYIFYRLYPKGNKVIPYGSNLKEMPN